MGVHSSPRSTASFTASLSTFARGARNVARRCFCAADDARWGIRNATRRSADWRRYRTYRMRVAIGDSADTARRLIVRSRASLRYRRQRRRESSRCFRAADDARWGIRNATRRSADWRRYRTYRMRVAIGDSADTVRRLIVRSRASLRYRCQRPRQSSDSRSGATEHRSSLVKDLLIGALGIAALSVAAVASTATDRQRTPLQVAARPQPAAPPTLPALRPNAQTRARTSPPAAAPDASPRSISTPTSGAAPSAARRAGAGAASPVASVGAHSSPPPSSSSPPVGSPSESAGRVPASSAPNPPSTTTPPVATNGSSGNATKPAPSGSSPRPGASSGGGSGASSGGGSGASSGGGSGVSSGGG